MPANMCAFSQIHQVSLYYKLAIFCKLLSNLPEKYFPIFGGKFGIIFGTSSSTDVH